MHTSPQSGDAPLPPARHGRAAGGGTSFLGIALAPGITRTQVAAFVVTVLVLNCLQSFVNVMQPFLVAQLGVAATEQGRVVGDLAFWDQLAFLLFIAVSGSLADSLGRRRLLLFALASMVILLGLFPLAPAVAALAAMRFAFGTARTSHTVAGTASIMDIPATESRGRFVSLMLVSQGLAGAVLVGLVGSRLPGWLQAAGWSPDAAVTLAFAAFALLGLVAIGPAVRWLRRDAPPPAAAREPFARQAATQLRLLAGNFRQAWASSRANPRYRFVMLMALVIRSDFVVMDTFLTLWIMRGAQDAGLGTTEALARAGIAFSVLRVATMLSPLAFGILADRVDRLRLLGAMLFATALAFGSTILVVDVTGTTLFVVIALIGVAESGTIVAAQAVLGDESPAAQRGTSMAIFAFLGTIGVLVASVAGGRLFDWLGYQAPFLFVAAFNLLFALWALKWILRSPPPRTSLVED